MKKKNVKISVGPRQVSLFISFPPIEYIATVKGLKLELSCESPSWKRLMERPLPGPPGLRLSQKWTVGSFPLNAVLGGVLGEVGLAPPL